MGMPIVADVRDECSDETLDELFDWFREVDARFSTYKDDSEISRLNRGELTVRECHPDVRWVLARCDELREETGGYFDARYESLTTVDPSGLVKGWSVDRGGELLEARGIRNYSINAGGDIRMRGAALPEPAWRTGIQHPQQLDRIAAIVEANDLALATSGTYIRGEHIVDPHSGEAPSGLLSVTDRRRRPRDGRCLRHGRLRDGHAGSAVDGAAPSVRGALAPRRRHVALDARLPVRAELSRRAEAACERAAGATRRAA